MIMQAINETIENSDESIYDEIIHDYQESHHQVAEEGGEKEESSHSKYSDPSSKLDYTDNFMTRASMLDTTENMNRGQTS